MKFLNLTPHPIRIFDEWGKEVLSVAPAENMRTPRVMQTNDKVGSVGGVPLYRPAFGAVANLPDPCPDTMYIVSRMVRQASSPTRTDVVCPGPALRDQAGNIIGARGLSY